MLNKQECILPKQKERMESNEPADKSGEVDFWMKLKSKEKNQSST